MTIAMGQKCANGNNNISSGIAKGKRKCVGSDDPICNNDEIAIKAVSNSEQKQEVNIPSEDDDNSGKGTTAINAADKEILENGKSNYWKERGNLFYRSCKFEEALSCYDRALSLEPQNGLFMANRCACLLERGNYFEAMQEAMIALCSGMNYTSNTEDFGSMRKRLISRFIRAAYYSGVKGLAYKMLSNYRETQSDPALARMMASLEYSLNSVTIYRKPTMPKSPISLKDSLFFLPSSLPFFDQLPRFRSPRLNEGFEYCPWGHGYSVSCLSGHLIQQDVGLNRRIHKESGKNNWRIQLSRLSSWQLQNTLHFFMGGCCDLRSILITLMDAHRQINSCKKAQDRVKISENISMHFCVNDVNPVVLARIIVLMIALEDLGKCLNGKSQQAQGSSDSNILETSAFVYFLYFGVVMPPYLYDRLMKLLDSCILSEEPLRRFWCRFASDGPESKKVWQDIKGAMKVWRNQRNPLFNAKSFLEAYEIENPMNEGINQARCQIQQDMLLSYLEQLSETELSAIFPDSGWSAQEKRDFLRSSSEIISSRAMYLNGCVADVAWLHQTGALIPPAGLLNRERPSFQQTMGFLQKFYAGGLNRRDLGPEERQMMVPAVTHVISTWKPNVLLYDEKWVRQNEGRFSAVFHPNELMESLLSMDWLKDPSNPSGFFDWSNHFFSQAAQALYFFSNLNQLSTRTDLDGRRNRPLTLDFMIGDMHTVADEILSSKNYRKGVNKVKSPSSFLRIYVNNVPDYCGLINLFTKMSPLLKDDQSLKPDLSAEAQDTMAEGNDGDSKLTSFIESYVLLNTGIWKDLEQVVHSHCLVPSLAALPKYLGLELMEGGLWQGPTKWKVSQKGDIRLSPMELNTWLYRVFYAICLPVPMDPHLLVREYFPNNLTAFLNLLEYLWKQEIVPVHWLSQCLESILDNTINSQHALLIPDATPNPVTASTCDPAKPNIHLSVAPFLLEFKTVCSLWVQKTGFPLVNILPLPERITTCECIVDLLDPFDPDLFGHAKTPVLGLAIELLTKDGKSMIFDALNESAATTSSSKKKSNSNTGKKGKSPTPRPDLYKALKYYGCCTNGTPSSSSTTGTSQTHPQSSNDVDEDYAVAAAASDDQIVFDKRSPPIHIFSVFEWDSVYNRIIFTLPIDIYWYFQGAGAKNSNNNWTLFLFRTDSWIPVSKRHSFTSIVSIKT